MLSYHNDENLKKMVVLEMKKHQEQDQIIKGSYREEGDGKFKGCAVGCTIDSINIVLGKSYNTSTHSIFEETIGVPEWLARVQDTIFEGLPHDKNSQFAIDFLEAIPVGVNLNPIKWKFCSFILKEGIERMISQANLSDELREKVIKAMRSVLSVHELAIKTGEWNSKLAASAASAAESAARSARYAAESSAWSALSAAESSARYAAESSAWSALSAAESSAWSAARSAWSARSAAESSAWSAARSAWSARSAAESAWSAARSEESARSAAWSALSAAWSAWSEESARSAEYERYATELIRILKEEI